MARAPMPPWRRYGTPCLPDPTDIPAVIRTDGGTVLPFVRIVATPAAIVRRVFVMNETETPMFGGILLWLLGIPLPIIILLLLFWH